MAVTNLDDLDCSKLSIGGVNAVNVETAAAAVAALTENAAPIGGTNDGNLPDLSTALGAAVATTGATNTTPYGFTTAAQADNLVARVNTLITVAGNLVAAARENAAKNNQIIAALKAAGLMET